MSNIYLRVSKYVAAFMRGNGDGQSLLPSQPISFSPYSQEYVILVNGLRMIPEAQQHWASCYSQAAWQNMCYGILPQGGKAVIKRDPAEYLSYAEVCTLEHLPNKTKKFSYEFLCISIPSEIFKDGRITRTNKRFTLDTRVANHLRKMLRNLFIRTFLDFENRSKEFAKANGFERSNIEIIERFLMRYDIPVSHDHTERDTLNRLSQRWRKEARMLFKDKRIISDTLVTRIDEHELRGGLPSYD